MRLLNLSLSAMVMLQPQGRTSVNYRPVLWSLRSSPAFSMLDSTLISQTRSQVECMLGSSSSSSSSSSSYFIYPRSFFRVAYAANISEHLPTQPWDYRHKVQTTTPGTTSPTLCEQWVGSLTSHRVIYEQGLWDGTSGLSSLSEKTRKSNHLQMSLQRHYKGKGYTI